MNKNAPHSFIYASSSIRAGGGSTPTAVATPKYTGKGKSKRKSEESDPWLLHDSTPSPKSSPHLAAAIDYSQPSTSRVEIVEPAEEDESLKLPDLSSWTLVSPDLPNFPLSSRMTHSRTRSRSMRGFEADLGEMPATPLPEGKAALRQNLDTLVKDPFRSLPERDSDRRNGKFLDALATHADISSLRSLSWSGVPYLLRPVVWGLLVGYYPSNASRRIETIARKREEYASAVAQAYTNGIEGLDQTIYLQLIKDLPRTAPMYKLWNCATTQKSMERILYLWSLRHPASGYVQGMNDLLTPLYLVFLSAYLQPKTEVEDFDTAFLPASVLAAVEADSYYALTKVLDGIADHYTPGQAGIMRGVVKLGHLLREVDRPLSTHMQEQGVEGNMYAFRWYNCLLMREMDRCCVIRMWDTYLAEGLDSFSQFHLYVCCSFLTQFSHKLRKLDFQEMIMFLQQPPTDDWGEQDVGSLMSQAWVLKSVWSGARLGSINGSGQHV